MPGFRFRIDGLPEQSGERKIPVHWLYLLLGVFLLGTGLIGVLRSSRLKGPPNTELHALKLATITNVLLEPEIPGSASIDNIWLQSPDGRRIQYRTRFPYSEEVRQRDARFGLLLDNSNRVWSVTTGNGQVLGREFFEDYHIEAKSVGKYAGSFLAAVGALILVGTVFCERDLRAGKPLPAVRVRQIILWAGIIAYMIFCYGVLFPSLRGRLPQWFLGAIWVLGGGLIGNGIIAYFRKHPPDHR